MNVTHTCLPSSLCSFLHVTECDQLTHSVIPAQAGIHFKTIQLDSRLRGNDDQMGMPTIKGIVIKNEMAVWTEIKACGRMTKLIFLSTIILIFFLQVLQADIKSTGSSNINFNLNNDTSTEMQLTPTGLGIGTITSQNLHVIGQSIFSSNLFVGVTSGNASLVYSGLMQMNVETVSSNTTLSGNSIIFAGSASANITLTLPSASSCNGRVYRIKKDALSSATYGDYQHVRVAATTDLIDGHKYYYMSRELNELPFLSVISDGTTWRIIAKSPQVTPLIGWENCIGYWKLDETSGTSAADSSRYDNTGTLNNFTFSGCTVSGNVSTGLGFDGSNDWLGVNGVSNLDTPDAITVALWIYDYNGTTTDFDITKDSGTNPNRCWGLRPNSATTMYFHLWSSAPTLGALIPANSYVVGSWFHSVCTGYAKAGTIYMAVYKNGVLIGTTTFAGTQLQVSTAQDIWMGADVDSYTREKIDDVRLYNRALTTDEIWWIYQEGL